MATCIYSKKTCPYCSCKFKAAYEIDVHLFNNHREHYLKHVSNTELVGSGESDTSDIRVSVQEGSYIDNYLSEYKFDLDDFNFKSPSDAMSFIYDDLVRILKNEIELKKQFKVFVYVSVLFSRFSVKTNEKEFTDPLPVFLSWQHSVLHADMINQVINSACQKIDKQIDSYIMKNSGWAIESLQELTLRVLFLRQVKGSGWIETPIALKAKERSSTIINIKCTDNLCFAYSILAKLFPPSVNKYAAQSKPESYRDKLSAINLKGVTFPMTIKQIPAFLKNNPDISLTVFGFDVDEANRNSHAPDQFLPKWKRFVDTNKQITKNLFPIYTCEIEKLHHVDLLLLLPGCVTNSDQFYTENLGHFVLINNLPNLIRNGHNSSRQLICRKCLNTFNKPETLLLHKEYCKKLVGEAKISKNPIIAFEKFEAIEYIPFYYVLDFESALHPISEAGTNHTKIQRHVCASYSWVCVNTKGDRVAGNYFLQTSETDNPTKRAIDEMLADSKIRIECIRESQQKAKKRMKFSSIDAKEIMSGTSDKLKRCIFCQMEFTMQDFHKGYIVRDHSHSDPYTFRGFAHHTCNNKCQIRYRFPCILIGGSSYDNKLICQVLHHFKNEKIHIIPRTSERFVSISIGPLQIIDALSFFSCSLNEIVNTLYDRGLGADKFSLVKQEFANEIRDGLEVSHLFAKSIFPYNLLQSWQDFKREDIWDRNSYYNDLKSEEMDEETFNNAILLWKQIGIKNLGELCLFYNRLDTILLASAVDNLRHSLFNIHGLDCLHFVSLSQFVYQCCLKTTNVRLEQISSHTDWLFLTKSIYGGLATIGGKRLMCANNKYMPNYDNTKPSTFIGAFDCNGLYAHSFTFPLPVNGYKLITGDEVQVIVGSNPTKFIHDFDCDGPYAYFVEADINIPTALHSKFSQWPLVPVHRTVSGDEFSPYQKAFKNDLEINDSIYKQKRLICDLNPKEFYVAHIAALQLYVKLGILITRIHKLMFFNQERWANTYVEKMCKLRSLTRSRFQNNLLKSSVNHCYGKLLERKQDRCNVRVVTSAKQLEFYSRNPLLHDVIPIHKDLVLFIVKKRSYTLSTPIAVGSAILWHSKTHMAKWWYFVLTPSLKNLYLGYSDTDSAYFICETDDLLNDLQTNKEWFDNHTYSKDDPLFSEFLCNENMSKHGCFKNEYPNAIITNVCALKSKNYSVRFIRRVFDPKQNEYIFIDGDTHGQLVTKKVKGVPISAVSKQTTWNDFVNSLYLPVQTYVIFKCIRSRHQDLVTMICKKRCLNGMETKRYLLDAINTLPYGSSEICKAYN